MKRLLLIIALAVSGAAFAQGFQPPVLSMFSADDQANSREEELYRDGSQYLDENKWGEGLQKFD
jgi:hypothetical protein